jgi:DNA-binding NtrC family response regulator
VHALADGFEQFGHEVFHAPSGKSALETFERTLLRHEGNRTRAAQELGISRAALINKIKVYGLGEVR